MNDSTKTIMKKVTVQPFISYIHKPASELSVAALQLMFTHFRNERLFYHKKVLNNTMNKLIVLPIIFLWLNCYQKNNFIKGTLENILKYIYYIMDTFIVLL